MAAFLFFYGKRPGHPSIASAGHSQGTISILDSIFSLIPARMSAFSPLQQAIGAFNAPQI